MWKTSKIRDLCLSEVTELMSNIRRAGEERFLGRAETTKIRIASLTYYFKYNHKMQPYTIFFITVNALHVSGGFSAHHQELKNCTRIIGYASSKQAWHITDAVCTVFELLMMGGKTARNM